MKVIVTGPSGQIGNATVEALNAHYEVIPLDRRRLDFEDTREIKNTITALKPDWIVNCAAFTNVDLAEAQRDTAQRVNAIAPGRIAAAALECRAKMIQISTDFVFSGEETTPRSEDDTPTPVNAYGRFKLQGERAVQRLLPDAVVLRTSWVYGNSRNNFVAKIIELAKNKRRIEVVDDQLGSPTWTRDIASCIAKILSSDARGIFHYCNKGVTTRKDFAQAIVSYLKDLDVSVLAENIRPISTPTTFFNAQRPAYSALSTDKIEQKLNISIPCWQSSLRKMLHAKYCQ